MNVYHPKQDSLVLYLDDQLSSSESDSIVEHIQQCDECQIKLDQLCAVEESIESLLKDLKDYRQDPDCKSSQANGHADGRDEDLAAVNVRDIINDYHVDNNGQARYKIIDEIARGGMGVIFRAYDNELKRDLALKVMLAKGAIRESNVSMFLREARITGQMQHPGVVPIHELGHLSDGRPFIAMKLVRGQTFRKLIKQEADSENRMGRLLDVFGQVCQTMAYAHSRGIIHRDLKPENVMVGAFGEVQIMDWGLAKKISKGTARSTRAAHGDTNSLDHPQAISSEDVGTVGSDDNSTLHSHTRFGVVMGTPAYMPPEQSSGDIELINERADVFSLGVILCEILTGRPPSPVKAANNQSQLRTELDDCNAATELVELARMCLEYHPQMRPANAGIVADRMASYFDSVDQKLRDAELETTRQRTQAIEEKRRRTIARWLVASVVTTLLVSGVAWIWLQNKNTELNNTRLQSAQKQLAMQADANEQAQASRDQSDLMLGDVYASRGIVSGEDLEPGLATMWFSLAAEISGADPDRQKQNLIRAKNWSRLSLKPAAACNVTNPWSVKFQPGGKLLLVRYKEHENGDMNDLAFKVLGLNNPDGEQWYSRHFQGIAEWSHDGNRLAIADRNGHVAVRRVADGKVVFEFDHPGSVDAISFSSDGRQIATAGSVIQLRTIDQTTLTVSEPVSWDCEAAVHSLGFNGDHSILVAACTDNQARLFSTTEVSDDPFLEVEHTDNLDHTFCYSRSAPVWIPPGSTEVNERLATIVDERFVAIWDVQQKKQVDSTNSRMIVLGKMAHNPFDDSLAISGYYGPEIRPLSKLDQVDRKLSHTNFVGDFDFSSDGKLLLSGAMDHHVQLWSVADGTPVQQRIDHSAGVTAVDLSDDDRWIATASGQGLVRIWRRADIKQPRRLAEFDEFVRPLVSHDGRYLVSAKQDHDHGQRYGNRHSLAVFEMETGKPVGTDPAVPGESKDACFSSRSHELLVVSQQGGRGFLIGHDLERSSPTFGQLKLSDVPWRLDASSTLPIAAVICHDNVLNVFDLQEQKLLFKCEFEAKKTWPPTIQFTPDGRKIVVCNHQKMYVLDATTGQHCFPGVYYSNADSYNCDTAMAPCGKYFAIASSDLVKVFSLEDGKEVGGELQHTKGEHGFGSVNTICFSPDSSQILSSSFDSMVRLWDWQVGKLACPPMRHELDAASAIFTPDGKFAITGSRGQQCGPHFWELTTGKKIAPSRKSEFERGGQTMSYLATSANGDCLISLSDTLDATRTYQMCRYDLRDILSEPVASSADLKLLGELSSAMTITLGEADLINDQQWWLQWQDYLASEKKQRSILTEFQKVALQLEAALELVVGQHFDQAVVLLDQTDQIIQQSEYSKDSEPSERQLQLANLMALKTVVMAASGPSKTTEFDDCVARLHTTIDAILSENSGGDVANQAGDNLLELARSTCTDPVDARLLSCLTRLNLDGRERIAAACMSLKLTDVAIETLAGSGNHAASPIESQLLSVLANHQQQAIAPDDAAYLNCLGQLEQRVGQAACVDVAIELFERIGKKTNQDALNMISQWKLGARLRSISQTIEHDPEDAEGYFQRGDVYGQMFALEKAKRDLTQNALMTSSNHWSLYKLAAVYAKSGDAGEYQKHCERLAEEWGNTNDKTIAERNMIASLLMPNESLLKSDPVVRAAEMIVTVADDSYFYPFFRRSSALHAYRSGDFHKAASYCQESLVVANRDDIPEVIVAVLSLESMTSLQQGNRETAKAKLQAAKKACSERKPAFPYSWHDWLMAEVLLAEAQELFDKPTVTASNEQDKR